MPDGSKRWLVLTVEGPSRSADALAEGLLALGGSAIEENGATLTTYVAAPADVDAWLKHARALLLDVDSSVEVDWRWQDDEDWSVTWKRGLQPRRVGNSFIVAPSWTEPELRPGDHVIVIDPEMAFGTGEHGTTRGALRFLEQVVQPGMRVLDVGTGSAILAIAAAQLGAAAVIAIDSDPDAILNARDNVERNGVAARITLDQGFVDIAYLDRYASDPFDVIVANVLSGVLTPLLGAFRSAIRPGCYVILGGILVEEADAMRAAIRASDLEIMAEDREEEWWGVLLRRPA